MYDPTAAGVELPHKPAHRPRTMEASQVRDYLRALWGHECEAVAICSVTLGLRRGEACGLWVQSSGAMYIANFGGTGLSGTYSFSCTACWPAA